MNQTRGGGTLLNGMPASIRLLAPLPPVEDSFDALLERAKDGEEASFDAFVRATQQRALGFAIRQLPRGGGEDALQNAYLELHRALPRYEPQGKALAYFYRILVNQCRKVGRMRWAKGIFFGSSTEVEAASSDATAPAALLPLDSLIEEQTADALWQAVDALPKKQRDVIMLRMQGDLSYDDISEALGVPPGTAKSRAHHAIARLRDALETEEAS